MPKKFIEKRSRFSGLGKEFLSEVIGTAILMLLGLSGSACFTLSGAGTPFGAAFGFCFGAIIASFCCGPISGAQINPAFTFAFCVIGKTHWNKCVVYILAQYIGSFIGSGIVYSLYFESIPALEQSLGLNSTSLKGASIFITSPAPEISLWVATMDQVVSTALLCFAVLFITDDKCFRTPDAVKFLTVGLTIMSFVVAFGHNSGAILNPARDLAPRILLSMVGYQSLPFQSLNYQFWWAAGILGPHVGAVIGAVLYRLINKLREEKEPEDGATTAGTGAGGDGTDPTSIAIDRKQAQMISQIMAGQLVNGGTNNGPNGPEQDIIYQKDQSNSSYCDVDDTSGATNNKNDNNDDCGSGGGGSTSQLSNNNNNNSISFDQGGQQPIFDSSTAAVAPSSSSLSLSSSSVSAAAASAAAAATAEAIVAAQLGQPPKKFIFFNDLPDFSPTSQRNQQSGALVTVAPSTSATTTTKSSSSFWSKFWW